MAQIKRFVYVLRSVADQRRYDTGLTADIVTRIAGHNARRCPHTANGRPWSLDVLSEFADQRRAIAFEQFLKSGSGRAFAKRHLR
jgi:putative endonuclease